MHAMTAIPDLESDELVLLNWIRIDILGWFRGQHALVLDRDAATKLLPILQAFIAKER